MGWECHWVWRNVCFSYRHFTCPVTPCPPRARLIFGKAATRTGPLCGGFALGRCCPVLVAGLPLWVHPWLLKNLVSSTLESNRILRSYLRQCSVPADLFVETVSGRLKLRACRVLAGSIQTMGIASVS